MLHIQVRAVRPQVQLGRQEAVAPVVTQPDPASGRSSRRRAGRAACLPTGAGARSANCPALPGSSRCLTPRLKTPSRAMSDRLSLACRARSRDDCPISCCGCKCHSRDAGKRVDGLCRARLHDDCRNPACQCACHVATTICRPHQPGGNKKGDDPRLDCPARRLDHQTSAPFRARCARNWDTAATTCSSPASTGC